MYQLYIEKIAKLISLGIYQRAFNLPPPVLHQMYRSKQQKDETSIENEVMNVLKVVFFTMVYNDPLVRMGVKSFMTIQGGGRPAEDIPVQLRQETLQA
jgi:hypothetical protein